MHHHQILAGANTVYKRRMAQVVDSAGFPARDALPAWASEPCVMGIGSTHLFLGLPASTSPDRSASGLMGTQALSAAAD